MNMTTEYIDVDYKDEPDNSDDSNKNGDINVDINTDPITAAVNGVCEFANNIVTSVKEYGMCKQQEKTKREAIKAQMKVEMEKINAQKEIYMKFLDQTHEQKMYQLKNHYEKVNKALDAASEAVHEAVETAKESKNFTDVIALLEFERVLINDSSEIELKYMESFQKDTVLITNNSVKGLLE